MLEVKIKKLNSDAVIPSYSTEGDAGLDITGISYFRDDYGNHCYQTGIAIEIPEGYVGLLFPRSSISKYDLSLTNSVGIIDANYRGQIIAKFKDTSSNAEYLKQYTIGDRICQLMILPYPKIKFIESDTLSETIRGEGGFGSTGK